MSGSLPAALDATRDVEGWMTEGQARRLWQAAALLRPPARIVEIGSFRGKSAIVLARAAEPGVELVAIDPHAGSDRGPQEIAADAARGESDFTVFHRNLAAAGVADRVRHVRLASGDALDAVPGPIHLLYVDGAHRFGPARDDIVSWGARVVPGGTLLVHDCFSSVGVTLALLTSLVWSGEWVYLGRTGSLAEWRRRRLSAGQRAGNVVRQLAELPWFARNVGIKAAILTGRREGPWPY